MNQRPMLNDASIYFKLPYELKTAAEDAAEAADMTLAAWLRQIMRQATEQKGTPEHV